MIYTIVLKDSETSVISDVIQITVTDFDENYSASVTSFPVERGMPVSDNMVLDNDKYSIGGIVSSYSTNEREIALVDDEFILTGEGSSQADIDSYPLEIKNKLKDLIQNKRLFSIYLSKNMNDYVETLVEEIPSCVLRNLSFKDDAGKTGAIWCNLSIERLQVTSVKTELVTNMIPQLSVTSKTGTGVGAANSLATELQDLQDQLKSVDESTRPPVMPEKKVGTLSTDQQLAKEQALKVQEANIQKQQEFKKALEISKEYKVKPIWQNQEIVKWYDIKTNTEIKNIDQHIKNIDAQRSGQ